ncbi:MAG: (2Fe-2S)-binding protein [Alphaproteobacteria bacterium]
MYVCICNRYRDAEIRALAKQGVRCARQAYSQLGNGPECGQCLDFAQEMIDTELLSPVDNRQPETV